MRRGRGPHVDLFTPMANKGVSRVVLFLWWNKTPRKRSPSGCFRPQHSALFLCIAAIVNSWHCWGRSSAGCWLFIASERGAWLFSNLEHFCLLFVVGDALEDVPVVAGSDLPAGPLVSSDLYSICHVKEQVALGEKMCFSNDSLLTGQLSF